MLARVPSGIDSDVYDMLHAYLILDIFEAKDGSSDKLSEKIDDYSYTKDPKSIGHTVWRSRFEAKLALLNDVQPSVSIPRSDLKGARFLLDGDDIGGMSDA
jgi:hypothetical protein